MKPEMMGHSDGLSPTDRMLPLSKDGTNIIHYSEFGQGEPLILLPSLWLTRMSYRALGEHLAPNYHVFIPDLFRGTSTFSRNATTLAQYTDGLNRFIDGIGVKEPYLVGISMSGFIASKFVQEHASTVKKLFLVSSSPIPLDLDRKTAVLFAGYAKLLGHNMKTSVGRKTNRLWIQDSFQTTIRHPRQMIHDARIMISDYNDWNTHELPVQTKLLFALHDEFLPSDILDSMQHLKNLSIETIPGHHAWFFGREKELAGKITQFFSEGE